MGYLFWNIWHWSSKYLQILNFIASLSCLPEHNGKILSLNILQTFVIEIGQIILVLAWTRHLSWQVFMVLKGALPIIREKSAQHSYLAVSFVS